MLCEDPKDVQEINSTTKTIRLFLITTGGITSKISNKEDSLEIFLACWLIDCIKKDSEPVIFVSFNPPKE